MNTWNPELYLKFEEERTQPSCDLVSRIKVANPAYIVDIGCGPGNSTRVLRERWKQARILGLDSSPEMIEKARHLHPDGEWILADAGTWQPDRQFDIVFSNATLQWIPNHETLIARLFNWVKEGGALAVQIPANTDSPLHQAVLKVSQNARWKNRMLGCESVLTYRDARFYYSQLSALSHRFSIWRISYYHVLDSHKDLIDWYAGTGMKVYLERLNGEQEEREFKAQTLEECRAAYPEENDGKILYPFQRLFFVAYKD